MMGIRILITVGALSFSTTAMSADEIWRVEDVTMPESMLELPGQGNIIVSVMAGAPAAEDGTGYLSLLSSDGEVLQEKWAQGLNAPKGMAILGERLFVSDITKIRIYDLETGASLEVLSPEGAVFLNDVASDGESIFVTDMMTDKIWRYREGEMHVWMQGSVLNHPNGIHWTGEQLLVGTWGQGLQSDFTTDVPGDLLAIDLESQAVEVIAPALGNLDGIDLLGDDIVVSDWIRGAVYQIKPDGEVSLVLEGAPGLADISTTETGVLLVPEMLEGRLRAVSLPDL
ncbi:MAG: ATP/GTP-binding protein [Pseudomonadota bacterium]